MALTISSPLQAALDYAYRYGVVMYTFAFGTGTYGLWTAGEERTVNSVLYKGGGSAIDVSAVDQNTDGSVSNVTLSLSTAPDKGLTADVLLTFYAEDWHDKIVTIDVGMFDQDSRALIDRVTIFRGATQDAPYTESPNAQKIDLNLASRSIELSASGGGYRNAQSQARILAADTSLNGIGSLNQNIQKSIKWGQG